jgi:glutathione S-transferase
MKIYYHPASTTSRPVMLFAAENGINADFQLVDLFTGEHFKQPFEAINPNHLVPVLEDDGFRLTESSAILKYLADKIDSPAYPKELRQRARVNERMDWINTQVCRDFAYGYVYPQIFPMHKRLSAEVQAATLTWSRERAITWLKILDEHLIGPKNAYLCGNQMTIADYFGASFVALGELIRGDYADYPNVERWLGAMKRLKNWSTVNEAIDGFAASLNETSLQPL